MTVALSELEISAASRMGEAKISRLLAAAESDVKRASRRRAELPAGSSRARVTSANAAWAIACEYRDRLLAMLDTAKEAK